MLASIIGFNFSYLGTGNVCKCGANAACSGLTPTCKNDSSGTCVECNTISECTAKSDACYKFNNLSFLGTGNVCKCGANAACSGTTDRC